jgi:GTP-binding protein HflX
VEAADYLFATLDPASRRLRFESGREAIITDTVGFIRDLPGDLVQAFSATLEELRHADLLVHLVDISNPRYEEQMEAVEEILETLDLSLTPRLLVFNKVDLLEDGTYVGNLCRRQGAVAVSALNRESLAPLLAALEARLSHRFAPAAMPQPSVA